MRDYREQEEFERQLQSFNNSFQHQQARTFFWNKDKDYISPRESRLSVDDNRRKVLTHLTKVQSDMQSSFYKVVNEKVQTTNKMTMPLVKIKQPKHRKKMPLSVWASPSHIQGDPSIEIFQAENTSGSFLTNPKIRLAPIDFVLSPSATNAPAISITRESHVSSARKYKLSSQLRKSTDQQRDQLISASFSRIGSAAQSSMNTSRVDPSVEVLKYKNQILGQRHVNFNKKGQKVNNIFVNQFVEPRISPYRVESKSFLHKRSSSNFTQRLKEKLIKKSKQGSTKTYLIPSLMKSLDLEVSCLGDEFQQGENKWAPYANEGAAMVAIGEECYLIGGLSSQSQLPFAKLNKQGRLYQWQHLQQPSGDPYQPRYDHIALQYKDQIIVSGGESSHIDRSSTMREVINDMCIFNTKLNTWTQLKMSGEIVQARKGHSACIIGKFLIIYGGINSQLRYLDDTIVFDLEIQEWSYLNIQDAEDKHPHFQPPQLAYAQAVAVIKKGRKMEQMKFVHQLPGVPISEKLIEGMYLFGGLDGKDNKATNELYILRMGDEQPHWIHAETHGTRPQGRFQHSMTYHSDTGLIALFGGRNDDLYCSLQGAIFNDLFILNPSKCFSSYFTITENLLWQEVRVDSSLSEVPLSGRCNHAAAFFQDTLVIFGGVGSDFMLQPDMYLLEFNIYQ